MELSFSTQSRQQAKDVELRQHLLDCVNEESEQFAKLVDAFYAQDRRDDDGSITICKEIVALVSRVTKIEGWQESKFLTNLIKPFIKLQEQAQGVLNHFEMKNNVTAHHVLSEVTDDQMLVYISMFQTDGYDMSHWNLQLRNISHHLVGRPIYDSEETVIQVMRGKESQVSDAYLVCNVPSSSVLNHRQGEERLDSDGRQLVGLMPGSITEDSIREFVHMNKRYYWINSRLELINNSEGK